MVLSTEVCARVFSNRGCAVFDWHPWYVLKSMARLSSSINYDMCFLLGCCERGWENEFWSYLGDRSRIGSFLLSSFTYSIFNLHRWISHAIVKQLSNWSTLSRLKLYWPKRCSSHNDAISCDSWPCTLSIVWLYAKPSAYSSTNSPCGSTRRLRVFSSNMVCWSHSIFT